MHTGERFNIGFIKRKAMQRNIHDITDQSIVFSRVV